MKIAVCLKYVPAPDTVEVDPLSGAIDARRLLHVVNPADESALELGLSIGAREVVALTVGPRDAEVALHKALACGASQAVRLWDTSWQTTDPFRTATLLCAALRTIEACDLVLCGARSSDRGTGAVPALVAEMLDWPVATDVTRVDVIDGLAILQRRLNRGAREIVELRLPAVIGVESGLATLRHAGLPDLISAHRAMIPLLTPAQLGLTTADIHFPVPVLQATLPPRPRPRRIFTPESTLPPHERIGQILSAGVVRKSAQMLRGDPEELAAAIVAFLKRRGFLQSGDQSEAVPVDVKSPAAARRESREECLPTA